MLQSDKELKQSLILVNYSHSYVDDAKRCSFPCIKYLDNKKQQKIKYQVQNSRKV